jgi:hypothetical protein
VGSEERAEVRGERILRGQSRYGVGVLRLRLLLTA